MEPNLRFRARQVAGSDSGGVRIPPINRNQNDRQLQKHSGIGAERSATLDNTNVSSTNANSKPKNNQGTRIGKRSGSLESTSRTVNTSMKTPRNSNSLDSFSNSNGDGDTPSWSLASTNDPTLGVRAATENGKSPGGSGSRSRSRSRSDSGNGNVKGGTPTTSMSWSQFPEHHHWVWLHFLDPEIELKYRSEQTTKIFFIATGLMAMLGVVNSVTRGADVMELLGYPLWEIAEDSAFSDPHLAKFHPCLLLCLIARIVGPFLVFALLMTHVYVPKAKFSDTKTIRIFEIGILLQIISDCWSDAIFAGIMGEPVPATIALVVGAAALSGHPWWFHAKTGLAPLGIYIVLRTMVSPEPVDRLHIVGSVSVMGPLLAISFLSDRYTRRDFLTRMHLDSFRKHMDLLEMEVEKRTSAPRGNNTVGGKPGHLEATSPRARESTADMIKTLDQQLGRASTVSRLFSRSEEQKSMFLARMAHELRSPLTAMLGCTDLLLSSNVELDHEASELVQLLQSAGKHQLSLLDEILDFSKVRCG